MCSPLNKQKSLIHICCSKWLCILWHYHFSCCHPCSSAVCFIFCQGQTLVAQREKRRRCTLASSSLRLHSPVRLGVVAKTPMKELRGGWEEPGTHKEELQMCHTATAAGGHSQPARGRTEKLLYSRKPQAFYGQFPYGHMMKNAE